MSIGRPQSFTGLVSTPPDRGSFPLDHYGECKEQMKAYLACLKKNRATSTPCRAQNKSYLECRMAKGLMERDEWEHLGLDKVETSDASSSPTTTDAPSSTQDDSASSNPKYQKR